MPGELRLCNGVAQQEGKQILTKLDHTILTLHTYMYVYVVVPWSRNNGGIYSLYIYDL